MRFAWLLLLLAPAASAATFVPGGNAGTLARQFALPVLGNAQVLAPGRNAFGATFDVTSEYVRENVGSESLEFDGETQRLRLALARGLGSGWEAGIEIPLLATGGGFLDSWIQDWHDTFGLPNGGRENAQDGQYRYRYRRGGITQFDVQQEADGLGDVSATLGYRLGEGAALRALAKLPTGDEATLLGGNAGGAVWLDLALPLPGAARGYIAGGVSVNGRSAVLPDQQARLLPFGGIGVLLPLGERVRISAQLQGHAALYRDSELRSLSRVAVPLTLGLQFDLTRRVALDVGFQEDPAVMASPDFSGYLSVSVRP